MNIRKHKKTILFATLLFIMVAGLVHWKTAFGVTRTWDGGGVDGTCGGAGTANNWTCAANWSADTVPTASDIAMFDGTSTKNAIINASINIAGINIAAGYSGTITQSSTYTITVGASHFVQAAGTFAGGSGSIDINGTFTLSSGTFTSTSGTLEVGRDAESETFFTVSGGSFIHNGGIVSFVATHSSYGNRSFTIDVNTSLTLYDVVINALQGNIDSNKVLLSGGDTIIASHNLTLIDGALGGTWEVQGNLTIGAGPDGESSTNATITYTGTGSKTYTYTGGMAPHLRVNNSGISVSPANGTTALAVSRFSLLAGTFTAPTGTMQVGRADAPSGGETLFSVSSGTFNHNNGTVVFSAAHYYPGNHTFTVDVPTTLTFFNVVFNASTSQGSVILTPGSGDTLIVANDFTHTNGTLDGTWEVKGNTTVGASADGGAATLSFTGLNSQTYTDLGGDEPNGNITVNKPVGAILNLASNADWNSSGQTTTITSGILNLDAYNLYTDGTLTVGASGVLHDFSSGDLILGGSVVNTGIIRLESSGACGYADAISITSSSGGTKRLWSGGGTYTLYDVSVQDQGSATVGLVTAYSSTSVSGNDTGFTFSGSACPVRQPAGTVNSGILNIGSGKLIFQ